MERKYIFDLNEFGLTVREEHSVSADLEASNGSYHTFDLDDGFFFTEPDDPVFIKIIDHLKKMQVYDEILKEQFPYILVSISW